MTRPRQSNVERLAGLLIGWIWGIVVAAVLLFTATTVFDFPPRDSTDTASERSGMTLFVDHGTGCQYVGWAHDALTPRLGPDGKQICGASR